MTFLPDVNLWLAMAFMGHVHHTAAKGWFDQLLDSCSFCRLTQQGFLRLATNPKALGREAVTLAEAWRIYDALANDPRVHFSPEPQDIEKQWRAYTQRRSFSPKVWNDAYLAAFARSAGFQLATFDKAFGQYKGLQTAIISSAQF